MAKVFVLATLLFSIKSCQTFAQSADSLRARIQQIVSDKNAVVGISITGSDGKNIVSLNAQRRYPLQSVFKFHIALAVLAQIDKGKFSLDHEIEIQKKDLYLTHRGLQITVV